MYHEVDSAGVQVRESIDGPTNEHDTRVSMRAHYAFPWEGCHEQQEEERGTIIMVNISTV